MLYGLTLLEIFALLLLAVITLVLASATLLSMLKEHKETGTILTPRHWFSISPKLMWRTLKGFLLTTLVIFLPVLLFFTAAAIIGKASPAALSDHLVSIMLALLVFLLAVLLFSLPLMHVFMKYVMEAPCRYWHTLSHHYGRAMRHWGSLFLVFFVSTLFVQLVAVVVMMPTYILQFANQSAHMGLLMGDPLGMPSYMTTLTFVTFLVTCFIQFYVSQIILVHNYYVYGSIEAKEQERAAANQ